MVGLDLRLLSHGTLISVNVEIATVLLAPAVYGST
jgi:hypothetical protein